MHQRIIDAKIHIMRTTIDLPDDLLRRAKAVAAIRGIKLKDLIASILAKGLSATAHETPMGQNRPLPPSILPAGRKIPSLTNAELEEIFLREDLEHWGLDRPA